MRRYLTLVPWLFAIVSCKDSSDEITRGSSRQLQIFCATSGQRVACKAFLSDPQHGTAPEVTSEATWLVSGAAAGAFAEPGLFVPSSTGDVGLSARAEDLNSNQVWFFVNPPQDARVLTFLNGVVRDERNAGIGGVDVQILDGHSAGARATTNSVGVYSFGLFQILTGEVFTIRASKESYRPSTRTHRVNFPFDPANPPFLDFVLRPLEAP